MKKLSLIITIISCFVLVSQIAIAQQGQFYQFLYKNDTKIKGSKIHFAGLKNIGNESHIDVNQMTKDNVDFFTNTYSGISEKKIQNHISWTRNPMFEIVENESEADVIIGGHYKIKTHMDIEEKVFYERQSNVGAPIPYYEIRQTNKVDVEVVISYTYKDKSTDYDTITISNSYERKPKTTYKSIEDLLEKAEKSLGSKLYHTFHFYEIEYVWYKFEKVKVKDKALKEELKSANDLLANGEIMKLGNLYKRIYEADKSNLEAAFNLAMCYELIGNYPSAEVYYAMKKDFHANTRMKKNMELYNYLKNLGANIKLLDF